MQWGGEEEQQPGVALRLPPPGQVGLGQRWEARVWLREQMGQTGSEDGHLGATWPKPQREMKGSFFFFFFFFYIIYSLLRYKKSHGALAMAKTKPKIQDELTKE